ALRMRGAATPQRRQAQRRVELLLALVLLVLLDLVETAERPGQLHPALHATGRRTEQHELAMLLRQLRKRRVGIDAERLREPGDGLPHQLAVAARPRRNRAAEQRF